MYVQKASRQNNQLNNNHCVSGKALPEATCTGTAAVVGPVGPHCHVTVVNNQVELILGSFF